MTASSRWSDALVVVRRVGLMLIVMPLVGLLAVMAADVVPDRWILDSLVDSVESGEVTASNFGPAVSGRPMDFFTDCIGITVGLGDAETTTRWSSALRSPTLGSCGGAVPKLQGYADGAGLERSYEYFRYWHGYTVVTRPAIGVLGLAATRKVTMWLMIGAVAGLGRRLGRSHGWVVSAALLVPVVLTTDLIELPRSLPHAFGALAALVTCWLAHLAVSRDPSTKRVAVVSCGAGATFVFFDILTISPGAWALFVFVVGLAMAATRSKSGLAGAMAVAGGCWIVGWSWMWITKWLLSMVVYGYDDVRTGIGDAVQQRLDGTVDYLDLSFGRSVRLNVSTWFDHPLTVPVVIALLVTACAVVARSKRDRLTTRAGDRAILAATALIPLVWFEVMRNHSQVHAHFTYRSVAVVAGIVAASAMIDLRRSRVEDSVGL